MRRFKSLVIALALIVALILSNFAVYADATGSHKFTFELNGGVGTAEAQTVADNGSVYIPADIKKDGYLLLGWNAKNNKSGKWYVSGKGWCTESVIEENNYTKKIYNSGRSYTIDSTWILDCPNSDYTMYAVWQKNAFRIKYLAEGGSGSMEDTIVPYGTQTPLRKPTFTKDGYALTSWILSRESDGKYSYKNSTGTVGWYEKGKQPAGYDYNYYGTNWSVAETVPVGDTVYFHAVWSASFRIVYLPEGGTGTMSDTIVPYGTQTPLAANAFKRSGYKMSGWIVSRASDGKYIYKNSAGESGWYTKDKQPSGYSYSIYDPSWAVAWTVNAGDTAYFHAYWVATSKNDAFVAEAKKYKGMTLSQTKKAMKKNGHKPDKFKGYWCYWFVRTCAANVGVSKDVVYRGQNNCDRNWYRKKGLYEKSAAWKGDYTPQKGDLVFFTWNTKKDYADHIGIITKVKGGKIYTIEGNSNNIVREKSYKLTSKNVLGYARVS